MSYSGNLRRSATPSAPPGPPGTRTSSPRSAPRSGRLTPPGPLDLEPEESPEGLPPEPGSTSPDDDLSLLGGSPLDGAARDLEGAAPAEPSEEMWLLDLAEARVTVALGPEPSLPEEIRGLLQEYQDAGGDAQSLYEQLTASRPAGWSPVPDWTEVDPSGASSLSPEEPGLEPGLEEPPGEGGLAGLEPDLAGPEGSLPSDGLGSPGGAPPPPAPASSLEAGAPPLPPAEPPPAEGPAGLVPGAQGGPPNPREALRQAAQAGNRGRPPARPPGRS